MRYRWQTSSHLLAVAAMTEPKRPSIVESLSAVMEDVREVRKTGHNKQQNYNFRGVDAVVNAVGPVLRRHGVVVVPFSEAIEFETYSTKGGTLMKSCVVKVRYVFYGPAGDTLECTVYGESSDAGDKSTPKAHSVAFRTALLQALCIPTDDPDPDEQAHERVAPVAQPKPFDLRAFHKACNDAALDPLDVLAHAEISKDLVDLDASDRPALAASLKALAAESSSPTPEAQEELVTK